MGSGILRNICKLSYFVEHFSSLNAFWFPFLSYFILKVNFNSNFYVKCWFLGFFILIDWLFLVTIFMKMVEERSKVIIRDVRNILHLFQVWCESQNLFINLYNQIQQSSVTNITFPPPILDQTSSSSLVSLSFSGTHVKVQAVTFSLDETLCSYHSWSCFKE